MTRRRFVTLDVFTQTPYAGNPLAVVLDAQGLDGAAMQRIAREFNLSETVFVLPPAETRHRARLRIFTPARELPFAGHPTVGAAVLLALEDARARKADAVAFGLEEEIGTVSCVVETGEGGGRARFKLPVLPEYLGPGPEAAQIAPALGLEPADIGFGLHGTSRHAAGVPFTFVPVASVERLDAIRLDLGALGEEALYVYAFDPEGLGLRFQARMFAPRLGIPEDPATGSAAAAFAGVLMQFERLGEGDHDVTLRQGVAFGRPSEIDLQVTIRAGALDSAEIGGAAVVVSEGALVA
ncbi:MULTISPECIES: PhzF family phenazine biosynthesis protein [Methylobacterium]|uniref:Trans-2,3-dihydro-3-hydroxyanthranilate isomerase n=4 Tax=Pseudomonadota TaxID=1224 RepID=A0ABQ4SST1_9HYPH|nr:MULTISPECIES: PhzF family phenazine biosynthesis protein [Methylobacterium]PIU05368.1 MAG: phenazine biosynthesis protein PhzF [Methylobacterium sp. CG09_land_8_20_14_0_10_71_15]PIU12170.1 MAG: phenazine biosynthesis protein PhzF [Methylobacterium sp. CG08_land_8_20_14_0_20_71_15]GBU18168.1 isomerase [Methylobacterium sp.]GJE06251.1 Trans-2,3-dihydro-3-hydroxyanthranilate isomerase [Methylobacterium jeotgali]